MIPEVIHPVLLCEQKEAVRVHTSAWEHVPHTFRRVDAGVSWSRLVYVCNHCGAERVWGGGEG